MVVAATASSAILYRSRRRVAVGALALTLAGAAAGTVTTLVVTSNNDTARHAVPPQAVPGVVAVSTSQGERMSADAAERWYADHETGNAEADVKKRGPQ
jgi:hypothetical protein